MCHVVEYGIVLFCHRSVQAQYHCINILSTICSTSYCSIYRLLAPPPPAAPAFCGGGSPPNRLNTTIGRIIYQYLRKNDWFSSGFLSSSDWVGLAPLGA